MAAHKALQLTDALLDYVEEVGVREHPVLTRCRRETAEMGRISGMQIAPEQGALMQMLVRLMGARRCLEVGVFTGYSALAVALALPEDGRIVACDISEEFTARARRYWAEAGVAAKIDLRVRPAADTLSELRAHGHEGGFDFAFIDADKTGYDVYYEHILALLRPGGLIAIDNVLWSGAVIDPSKADPDTAALRALNAKVAKDDRVDIALAPLSDGIFLVRKR